MSSDSDDEPDDSVLLAKVSKDIAEKEALIHSINIRENREKHKKLLTERDSLIGIKALLVSNRIIKQAFAVVEVSHHLQVGSSSDGATNRDNNSSVATAGITETILKHRNAHQRLLSIKEKYPDHLEIMEIEDNEKGCEISMENVKHSWLLEIQSKPQDDTQEVVFTFCGDETENDEENERVSKENERVSKFLNDLLLNNDWDGFAIEIDLLMDHFKKSRPQRDAAKHAAAIIKSDLLPKVDHETRHGSMSVTVPFLVCQKCSAYTRLQPFFSSSFYPDPQQNGDQGSTKSNTSSDSCHSAHFEYCASSGANLMSEDKSSPELVYEPPIPDFRKFGFKEKANEASALVAALGAASLALLRKDATHACTNIPQSEDVQEALLRLLHEALLRLLHVGGQSFFIPKSPTLPNIHHRFIFDVLREDLLTLASTHAKRSADSVRKDLSVNESESAKFTAVESIRHMLHNSNGSVMYNFHIDMETKLSGLDLEMIKSYASLYHTLASCAESSALEFSNIPVYGHLNDKSVATLSVIWRVSTLIDSECCKVVFAAQRMKFHKDKFAENDNLDAPLNAIEILICGDKLSVSETSPKVSHSVFLREEKAQETSIAAILAERVYDWIGSKYRNKGKRSRDVSDESNLTPSRRSPTAKRQKVEK